MQGAIARVCLVVTAAILNHPLLFPKENATVPDRDEEGLLDRMRAREEALNAERARLEEEMSREEASRGLEGEEDSGRYDWYFWTALSLVVFLTVEVCRGEFAGFVATPEEGDEDDWAFDGVVFPDKGELSRFWEGLVRSSALEGREFAEGLADDLLGALRDFEELEDCVCVGDAFETWTAGPPTYDLLVPLTLPVEDVPDCVCGSANLADDVLCLVHTGNRRPRPLERSNDPLRLAESSRSAGDRFANRFQVALTKAWGRIKRKYDFELAFRDVDALPGSLKVRFRSGRTIGLDLTPAIRYGETDAFYVPLNDDVGDWTLSLAVYEKNLLERFAKNFPEHPCHVRCLQILSFLREKQESLTGKSGLTDHHLKTALLHVLLNTKPSEWREQELEGRLRDVAGFLGRCLREKRLPHALLGNKRVPGDVGLPAEFLEREPPNLFRGLVLRGDLHARTVEHFREMLRNAGALVREYAPR